MSYKSGYVKEKDCKCSFEKSTTVNHAVTVVGYGPVSDDKDCQGYWLIKNSWGPNWGDKGFFKLCIPNEQDDKELPTGTC
jgi:cathepsin H